MSHPTRNSAASISRAEFRSIGHDLVDKIAELIEEIADRPVTKGESPSEIRQALAGEGLPEEGADPGQLISTIADQLIEHSLFNGHPRFFGYITGAPAPVGILGDMLAAAINPNVGAWSLAPLATEMELQTIRWIAELLDFPSDCGGVLVSGGNMANFIGFLAARKAKAPWDVQVSGVQGGPPLTVYISDQGHTWIQKAADEFGLGTDQIRWIKSDQEGKMVTEALRTAILEDIDAGSQPFMVIGTAGTVGLGAIDPLHAIARTADEFNLWFHVDGAYGGVAAAIPEAPDDMRAIALADSVAVDPHKWLYVPLEAGCALVRDDAVLREAFTYLPPYYKFDQVKGEPTTVMSERTPQNSRGFRALKVWLIMRQMGRAGIVTSIAEDIRLARLMYDECERRPEFLACSTNLSITTFQYVPTGLDPERDVIRINDINEILLTRLQEGGQAFVSHSQSFGRYLLRACIVNFRTAESDVIALLDIISRLGEETAREKRAEH